MHKLMLLLILPCSSLLDQRNTQNSLRSRRRGRKICYYEYRLLLHKLYIILNSRQVCLGVFGEIESISFAIYFIFTSHSLLS
jgi:hypothetical protein